MDSKFGSCNQTKEKTRINGLTDLTAKQKKEAEIGEFSTIRTHQKKGLETFKDKKNHRGNGLKSKLCRARLAIYNT